MSRRPGFSARILGSPISNMRRAVRGHFPPCPTIFFDRDGTLMDEVNYCRRTQDVRVIFGVAQALADLRERGWLAILITNQSGIGRGTITIEEYQAVHSELLRQIGNQLDGAYFCLDAPPTDSKRRKPEPGMIFEAMADFHIDPTKSWMVGDKGADIQCGQAAGLRTVLVRTGYGANYVGPEPDFVAESAVSAIHLILGATLDMG